MTNYLLITIGILSIFLIVAWLGLRVKPKAFPAYPRETQLLEKVPIPPELPDQVERYYREIYGERLPLIESAVISGRAEMRVFGITFPARFRFTHIAGQGYRHYIETTIFGFPIMKVNEVYLNENARLELPFGIVENEPKMDMAANLGLWAESIWLPSIFITDSRVRWEWVDETNVLLKVPFGDGEDTFTVKFDQQTGLITALEAKRYREAADVDKILWCNEILGWQTIAGHLIPSPGAATWMDQGSPWAVFTVDDIVYNVDVSDYIRSSGP